MLGQLQTPVGPKQTQKKHGHPNGDSCGDSTSLDVLKYLCGESQCTGYTQRRGLVHWDMETYPTRYALPLLKCQNTSSMHAPKHKKHGQVMHCILKRIHMLATWPIHTHSSIYSIVAWKKLPQVRLDYSSFIR